MGAGSLIGEGRGARYGKMDGELAQSKSSCPSYMRIRSSVTTPEVPTSEEGGGEVPTTPATGKSTGTRRYQDQSGRDGTTECRATHGTSRGPHTSCVTRRRPIAPYGAGEMPVSRDGQMEPWQNRTIVVPLPLSPSTPPRGRQEEDSRSAAKVHMQWAMPTQAAAARGIPWRPACPLVPQL